MPSDPNRLVLNVRLGRAPPISKSLMPDLLRNLDQDKPIPCVEDEQRVIVHLFFDLQTVIGPLEVRGVIWGIPNEPGHEAGEGGGKCQGDGDHHCHAHLTDAVEPSFTLFGLHCSQDSI